MTRLLAVVLFAFSTAATQASEGTTDSEDLVLGEFVQGSIITAMAFNLRSAKIEGKVNGNANVARGILATVENHNSLLAENKNSLTNQNLQISGLSTRVDSCIVLPSGCTAGQSITFDGSALVCADILPTCESYQTIIYVGGAWVCSSG